MKLLSILLIVVCLGLVGCEDYKNTLEHKTTNAVISIRLDEGIESTDKDFPDTPARIEIRIKQVKPNMDGVCNIKTGKCEFAMISLEHINMLDHFAHRYLEKKNDGWHGGCRLVIEGKEIEGKELK